jgi:hypothetical protein
MPNLPAASMDDDRWMFEDLFADERFRPDFLKIYPTLETPGTEIEALWERGEYQPYTEDELIDLVAYAKSLLPEYVRLQRIQRDIPARLITAGSRHSNFRQLAGARLREQEAGAGASGAVRQGGRPLRKRRLSRPWPIVHAAGRSGSYRQAQKTPSSGLQGSGFRSSRSAKNSPTQHSCANSMFTGAWSR